jgi:hypothetical protein
LFFDQVPERLVVPFAAIKGFLDPAVQFGLQFEVVQTESMAAETPKSATADTIATDKTPGDPEAAPADKVVSLDAFRKK